MPPPDASQAPDPRPAVAGSVPSLPIRFINLDRDQPRRDRLQAELARLHLAGERFPGVLWTALPAPSQDALYSAELNARQYHVPLVAGEKGCYASHIGVWRWLLASAYPGVVVLEDDVQLTEGFGAVCAAIAALPPDWDMIKLIGRPDGSRKHGRATSLCPGYRLVRFRRVPSRTAGYVVSRLGAEKLLATRVPFGRPVDVDLRHWWESRHLVVWGVSPAPIEPEAASRDSSIGARVSERGWRIRWRKFRAKFAYTIANAWHGAVGGGAR